MDLADRQKLEYQYAQSAIAVVQRLGRERTIRGIELWIANHIGDSELVELASIHRSLDVEEPLSHELAAVAMLVDFHQLWAKSRAELPDPATFDQVAEEFRMSVRRSCDTIKSIEPGDDAQLTITAEKTAIESAITRLRAFADAVEIFKSIALGSRHMDHNLAARSVRLHCGLDAIPHPDEVESELRAVTVSIEDIDSMIRQTLAGTEVESFVTPPSTSGH